MKGSHNMFIANVIKTLLLLLPFNDYYTPFTSPTVAPPPPSHKIVPAPMNKCYIYCIDFIKDERFGFYKQIC